MSHLLDEENNQDQEQINKKENEEDQAKEKEEFVVVANKGHCDFFITVPQSCYATG